MLTANSTYGKKPSHHPKSVLIVDPQTEGHHLTWIRYATNAFLSEGFKVTLMADLRKEAAPLVKEAIIDEIKDIELVSAFNEKRRYSGGSCLASIAQIQKQTPSTHIFMNELDLIASNCLRKAAMGQMPPQITKGILSGVYFRPRFLFESKFSLSNAIKSKGFQNLYKNKWFQHIFIMDEQKIRKSAERFPAINFHLLPDPWDGNFSISSDKARSTLNLPTDRFIVLQFGIGTKRKGLHLVVEAMEKLPEDSRVFLLCAGKLSIAPKLRQRLYELEKQNKAKIFDRYVTQREEELCFCASDAVLLPYVRHMGSSGVLPRAAAAGKPVIASDFDLTGWRVRHHGLGLLFQSENADGLHAAIRSLEDMKEQEFDKFHQNAMSYAKTCHLNAFKKALTAPF